MLLNNRIKTILIYASGAAFGGLLLMVAVLAFSVVPAGMNISLNSFSSLYSHYNQFYLLNLIPLMTGAAGAWFGRKISDNIEKNKNRLLQYESVIERTVSFVQQIENHDFNANYKTVNGESVLAEALESMRNSLITTSRRENERNEISRISGDISVLLQTFNNIDKLSEEIISFLVNRMENIVQGAFYVVEGEDESDKIIRMRASYAYNRRKNLHAEFRFAQGLVGQAAVEKDIIIRTEIPEDYMTIKSGLLGEAKPRALIISPLIADDVVYGVIELASFRKLSRHEYDIVKELSNIIAHAVANVTINDRTYQLLRESERMSSELVEQKRQLTRNSEDLMHTQAELRSANSRLEEQIREVHNASKKSQILLENSREVITIISEDRKIKYVSPSIKSILGYYPEELTGLNDVENVHPLDTDRFRQLISDLKSFPEKELTLQFRYFTKDGDVLWMEATGKNLLSDNVINGFVINTRDISEQRIAAKEQRIRAKMQALSENSSDIIIRIDVFSRCTYINPVIEEYTGLKKELYLSKPISNTEMDTGVVELLKNLLDETSKSKQKKTAEMKFPSPGGVRIMQVNAIPEFNENGESESVLFVCHDITEAKEREETIRKKNKSISDSINYAFNIQTALMPTEENLRKILPNSFMFYKPKDVVSGDYPWLLRKGDLVYVGAMDCTGHGVPGAMMSIIGYFLQDGILNNDAVLNAGDVLNKLHVSVVEKLKQAEKGSKINDGMDAAFCRYNLVTHELDYAGAHRPLYHVSNNVLNEVKADKYPVGSTQYRNRKDFQNHTIQIRPGDAVYFMTDGFPDQFGGPTCKQRFTSERVTKMISDNTHLSIFQMGNLFRNTFEEWRGTVNQLDDILIIGLKF
jgi:PAS domain S-box-containing protein